MRLEHLTKNCMKDSRQHIEQIKKDSWKLWYDRDKATQHSIVCDFVLLRDMKNKTRIISYIVIQCASCQCIDSLRFSVTTWNIIGFQINRTLFRVPSQSSQTVYIIYMNEKKGGRKEETKR
jgi:hypothetical protein